jgi:hypothetical protein
MGYGQSQTKIDLKSTILYNYVIKSSSEKLNFYLCVDAKYVMLNLNSFEHFKFLL